MKLSEKSTPIVIDNQLDSARMTKINSPYNIESQKKSYNTKEKIANQSMSINLENLEALNQDFKSFEELYGETIGPHLRDAY